MYGVMASALFNNNNMSAAIMALGINRHVYVDGMWALDNNAVAAASRGDMAAAARRRVSSVATAREGMALGSASPGSGSEKSSW